MIDAKQYVEVLKKEIEILNSRLMEYDTGHLFTTIDVLKSRIQEIESNIN